MRVTVRDVLRRPDLQLRLVGPDDDALDAEVSWVATSDLADPTPFLDRGNLLLTTGRQFDPSDRPCPRRDQRYTDDAEAYIAGLRRRGVSAVGFGLRVLHTGTPPDLIEACRTHDMPLFEVPYHVPFLAVVRAAADLIDAAGHRRASWALTATRAISTAVLRPAPIDATLGELGRHLGRGVILVDARGRPRAVHGLAADDPIVAAAAAEATRLLDRGRRAGAMVTVPHPPPTQRPATATAVGRVPPGTAHPDAGLSRDAKVEAPTGAGASGTEARAGARASAASDGTGASGTGGRTAAEHRTVLTMQTVGPDADLHSVLVLAGSDTIDPAEQTVVACAVALLWFALGEPSDRAAQRAALRRALWDVLVAGNTGLVHTLAPDAGMRLPPEPVRAVAWPPGPAAAAVAGLQAAGEDGRAVVFADVEGTVLACAGADDAARLAALDPERGAGISEPVAFADLSAAVERARRAARRARPGQIVALDDPVGGALAALVAGPDMLDLARSLLAPLEAQDRAPRGGLVEALAAWLRENGNYEAAARRLGLHRHTLAARIGRAAAVLDRDLDDVDVRTELWLALRTTGRAATGSEASRTP